MHAGTVPLSVCSYCRRTYTGVLYVEDPIYRHSKEHGEEHKVKNENIWSGKYIDKNGARHAQSHNGLIHHCCVIFFMWASLLKEQTENRARHRQVRGGGGVRPKKTNWRGEGGWGEPKKKKLFSFSFFFLAPPPLPPSSFFFWSDPPPSAGPCSALANTERF